MSEENRDEKRIHLDSVTLSGDGQNSNCERMEVKCCHHSHSAPSRSKISSIRKKEKKKRRHRDDNSSSTDGSDRGRRRQKKGKKKRRNKSSSSKRHRRRSGSDSSSLESDNENETKHIDRKRKKRKKETIDVTPKDGNPSDEAGAAVGEYAARTFENLGSNEKIGRNSMQDMEVEQEEEGEHNKQAVARRMVPMSREQYEAEQSQVREVYDPETGRMRLVRGSGEIIERIVSKVAHQHINRQATRGDGESFFSRSIHQASVSRRS
jgi:Nuclear RNA-splicing-associated protein